MEGLANLNIDDHDETGMVVMAHMASSHRLLRDARGNGRVSRILGCVPGMWNNRERDLNMSLFAILRDFYGVHWEEQVYEKA